MCVGGGGPFRTPKSQKITNKIRTIILHISGTFLKTCTNISLKHLHIYRKNTQNRIPIFKISIYNTKHTNNAKIHFKQIQTKSKIQEFQNFNDTSSAIPKYEFRNFRISNNKEEQCPNKMNNSISKILNMVHARSMIFKI